MHMIPPKGEGMKSMLRASCILALSAMIAGISGCEWEDSDDFNTSRGAGVNVNFSGVYKGKSGSLISGKEDVTQMVITQTGNHIDVLVNNVTYSGTIGSPGVVGTADATTGAYGSGANMLQAQVNFSGEGVAFVGIVRAIAVTDIQGTTRTETTTSTTNTWFNWGVGEEDTGVGGGDSVSQTDTETGTTEYEIDESNTMYVLEGNWSEGASVHTVSGIAHAASGSFVTSGTTTTTTTTS